MANGTPSSAALSRSLMTTLLISYLLNSGSGIGLWWIAPQTPLNQFMREVHGWSIPLFLIVLGIVWQAHILRGWKLGKNMASGVLLLGIFLTLIFTGWMLYYAAGDHLRSYARTVHTWMGLACSFVLFLHALLGWRSRS